MIIKIHHKFILLLAVTGLGVMRPVYGGPASGKPAPCIAARLSPEENITEKSSTDLETIRNRIIADLLAPAVDEAAIAQLTKNIKPDGSWPDINYQDVSRTGFQHKDHLENMLALSRAYKKPESKYYQKPEVKKAASAALDF